MKYEDSNEIEFSSLKMITIQEAAQLLNVPVDTIKMWSEIGVLKTYHNGRNHTEMFRLDDIETFLENDDGHHD